MEKIRNFFKDELRCDHGGVRVDGGSYRLACLLSART